MEAKTEPNIVSSFYKYTRIKDSEKLQKEILALCSWLELKGRIMVGAEGINGCVYGTKTNVEKFKNHFRRSKMFSDMEYKDHTAAKPAYRKIFVRIRNEIVNSSVKVDLKNTGKFLTPSQLKEMLDRREDIVMVDMRNDYEAKIGKFRNARTLSMKNFRELPNVVNEIEDLKDKKIVTYCTGGIRCEKASAYLVENGFKDVYQIKGGILKFGEEFPDTYWEGKCFVFDGRIAIDLNKNNKEPLTECAWCNEKCDDYANCHNLDCDKLFVCCGECRENHNKSCSEECSIAPKRRKEILVEN